MFVSWAVFPLALSRSLSMSIYRPSIAAVSVALCERTFGTWLLVCLDFNLLGRDMSVLSAFFISFVCAFRFVIVFFSSHACFNLLLHRPHEISAGKKILDSLLTESSIFFVVRVCVCRCFIAGRVVRHAIFSYSSLVHTSCFFSFHFSSSSFLLRSQLLIICFFALILIKFR